MKAKHLILSAVVFMTGVAIPGLGNSEAHAYNVTFDDDSNSYVIGLDQSSDIGRQLDPTTFTFDLELQGNNTVTLLGKSTVTVKDFTANLLSLEFLVKNDTVQSFQSAIVSLFFDIDPDVTRAELSDGTVFDTAKTDARATGGFKQVDVCILGSNNCAGGNINGGLQSGQSDMFTLNLYGDFSDGTVAISRMGAKFQTEAGSYTVAGVPEPFTILGSGMALGFGFLFKRESAKRKQKQQQLEKV